MTNTEKIISRANKYMHSQCQSINEQLKAESKPIKSNKKKSKVTHEKGNKNSRHINKPVTIALPIKIGFYVMLAYYLIKPLLG